MTRDVKALNRAQKLNLIKLTMQALQAKLNYLQENYNTYHENYSNEALQLYNVSFRFDSAVSNLIQSEGMDRLDDNSLTAMAELSLQVSELYKLGVRIPDDQKEYEATIKQFKKDVYAEALKRLEANKKETNAFETDLLAEAQSKGGKKLSPVYKYYDLQKQIAKNQYQIDYAGMMGNSDDYSKYYAVNKELKYKAKVIKENTPLLSHLPYEETIVKDIKNLCNKIRKAQDKVEKLLNKGKYPIWELNPVIAYIFETNEFYTPDKQEYIFDWIKEQERIDQLVDVFKNAIPIALSIMCFFMPGGVSLAMLILQGANAIAGAAAAYDDIQDAGAVRNMAYSQYPVSEEAQKIIDNTDLSAVERNYAMAILSGAFTMLDFAECVKIARKLGIGDEVMKYFAQGRKFRLSVDETEELVRKAKSAIDDIPVKTVNVDSVSQKYLENLNKKSINKLTRREDCYEILKKYEAYFGDNVQFVNELIENTPGKEIYVDPVKLLAKNAENEPNFYKFCQKIKTNCPTTEQWVKCQIDCYNSLSKDSRLRINAQPIISARYLKSDGSIDWPKFMGMKPETIKGISPDNNLPTNLSRKGVTDFGNTFGDNPNLTNAKIAIPYLDNPQAVHFANLSAEEKKRYFELIDALNNNDKSLFCSYFKDKKIAELTYDNAKKELKKFYDDVKKYMEVIDLNINIQGVVNETKLELYYISLSNGKRSNLINYKYGLSGVIAPWNSTETVLIGGGNQFSLPFTMDTLKKLQIIDRIY